MKNNRVSQLKKASRAILERGERGAIPDYFSPAYVVHVTGQDLAGGHELIRHVVELYQRAFTKITTTVEILAQQGDRVSWQRTLRATQRGPFKGFPPSHRRIVWREMLTSRFEDHLIVEEWFLTDLAEQLLLARKSADRRGRGSRPASVRPPRRATANQASTPH